MNYAYLKRAVWLTLLAWSLMAPGCSIGDSDFSEEEIRFSNGEVNLEGTLLTPDGEGPFPAVVFLHGSGPMSREGFRPYAEAFAGMGFASLFYDKRGAGSSGGSWFTSSLDDMAGDAAKAVELLRSRGKIDPDQIGFWGISQAGWVAPVAAAKDGNIGFMILISGGGASPLESELFSYRNEFEKAGLDKNEITSALGLMDDYFHFLETGAGREEFVSDLERLRKGTYPGLSGVPEEMRVEFANLIEGIIPSEGNLSNWSWVAAHDPLPYIRRLRCPLLLMFGELDMDHPTELAIEEWKEGLQEAGNDRYTIRVFEGAGHGIRMREGNSGNGRAPFAEGYRETQYEWLKKHVLQDLE